MADLARCWEIVFSKEVSSKDIDYILTTQDTMLCATIAMHPALTRDHMIALERLNNKTVRKAINERKKLVEDLPTLGFREVSVRDAKYIYQLRTNKRLNQYISDYKLRNMEERESLYLVLTNKRSRVRCGVVRLYNFKENSFEWGSWILDVNKTRYAAVETAILVYELGFKVFGFEESNFEVNKDNERVVSFHLKSGAKIVSEDEINFYFQMTEQAGLQFSHHQRSRLMSRSNSVR